MKDTSGDIPMLVGELAAMLERLIKLQIAVNDAIRHKLEAIRRADVSAIQIRAAREGELAGQVAELDQQRRAIVQKMCGAMSISAQEAGQEIALRSLARRMAPQWRDRLLSLSDELRERMLKVAESNRVVEMVCQEMSLHFKSLFAAMMNDGIDGGTYSDRGRVGVAGGARVLDAVG